MLQRLWIIHTGDCEFCLACIQNCPQKAIVLKKGERNKEARRAYLIGYDRSVPKLRQADHCIGCNQCSPHCPQRIDIPKQMQRINSYVEELKAEE